MALDKKNTNWRDKLHEIIYEAGSRVRDVEIGPDGLIYVALEDPGRIVRLSPYRK